MSFISWQYAVLLASVVLLYWRLPGRSRMGLLLLASYCFYGTWDARFLALILTSTVTDFICSRAVTGHRWGVWTVLRYCCLPLSWLLVCGWVAPWLPEAWPWRAPDSSALLAGLGFPILLGSLVVMLDRQPETTRSRGYLFLSLGLNLGLLAFFKYFGFFAESALQMAAWLGLEPGWLLPRILLPVGISFYTFQTLSYTLDAWRGKQQPTSNFFTFATYLSFFPQLVAGPIERSGDLMPQLERPAPWNRELFLSGVRLILIGLFKKVLVGDSCAIVANYAFDPATPLNAAWAWIGVFAFAMQIYGDFSGYTDIARGSAACLGIRLSRNFLFPYFATGPSDFWRRWHVTLSSWFRDYVYIPLGGNRHGLGRTLTNLVVVMALAGLWHGAAWTFVLWGVYHGALLVLYHAVPALRRMEFSESRSTRWGAVVLMTGWTWIGWSLFRASGLEDWGHWLAAACGMGPGSEVPALGALGWVLIHCLPLWGLQALTWKHRDESRLEGFHWLLRGLLYALLFVGVVTCISGDQEFIYFQF